jgi:3-oxoacyl-[acyl-carrier protein] reductase
MTDLLIEVSRRKAARRLVESLGLPLPLPRVLERAPGPWQPRELAGRIVGVLGFRHDGLADEVARVVAEMGAAVSGPTRLGGETRVVAGPTLVSLERAALPHTTVSSFQRASEAFGVRPAPRDRALHALLVDATTLTTVAELRRWFSELQELVSKIAISGRLVVFARGASIDGAEAAAVAAALEGFVRSTAKELGRRGATANLIVVETGAEQRAAAVARFLLSTRSAFVTAQPVHASLLARSPRSDFVTTKPSYVASLDRKVAVVTGAGRGIGEATARRLADEGAHVVCVDRPDDASAVAGVARAIGGSVFVADVASPETSSALAEHLRGQHSGVDIIVHNAGITRDRTFAKMSETEWNAVIDVNLGAVVDITSALLPLLRDDGRIICLSSVAGIAGNVGQTNYAASKAGLLGYVRALAQQVAHRGITVNAVAPGFIETRMTAAIPLAIREAGRRLSALGQGGLPIDVAEAITFLAQPASVGVTGAALRVCGGALIGA